MENLAVSKMNSQPQTSFSINRLIISAAILLVVLATLIAFGFFYYYNGEHSMQNLPPCLIYTLTGFKCPSCGLQRAVLNMVHGNFTEAIKQNALAVFLIVLGFIIFIKSLFTYVIGGKFEFPRIKNSHAYFLLITIIAYTILRNTFISL